MALFDCGEVGSALSDWMVYPVCSQFRDGDVLGGVLWPSAWVDGPFAIPDLDAAEAQVSAAEALALALEVLDDLDDCWLAVVLHPRSMSSSWTMLRSLSRRVRDLARLRVAAGRRLVIGVREAPGIDCIDDDLLRNLGALHSLGLVADELTPKSMVRYLGWPLHRLFLGASACRSIDVMPQLQGQWRFVARAASSLSIPVVMAGVDSSSELAWLRRHGCREAMGACLAPPLALGDFVAGSSRGQLSERRAC